MSRFSAPHSNVRVTFDSPRCPVNGSMSKKSMSPSPWASKFVQGQAYGQFGSGHGRPRAETNASMSKNPGAPGRVAVAVRIADLEAELADQISVSALDAAVRARVALAAAPGCNAAPPRQGQVVRQPGSHPGRRVRQDPVLVQRVARIRDRQVRRRQTPASASASREFLILPCLPNAPQGPDQTRSPRST